MKPTILLLLLTLLFSTSEIYAQRAVPSGSIQIASQSSETLQVEISGLLSFRENIPGNLLLSNLIPGEYRVRISGRRGSRIIDQRVHIQPGQRAVISISANNRVSVATMRDPNSSMLHIAGGGFPSPMMQPISDAYLSRMLSEVRRQTSDRNRFQTLEVAAPFHLYTSAQLRQILAVFTGNGHRLQAAEMLMPNVIDPQNLYLQVNVFTSTSYRNRFLDLIRKQVQGGGGSFNPAPMMQPINDTDLSRMLTEVRRQTSDRNRFQTLEVSAPFHLYTSAQLRQILAVFTGNGHRLQAAEMLMPNVIDPQNLYLQVNVFTSTSYRNHFLNLIREQMR